jgi:hypothetical protein
MWCALASWALGERERDSLTAYACPEALAAVLGKAKYRRDPLNGFLDYSSPPEYVQHLINNVTDPIGDCDDFHRYAAKCLARMSLVNKVYYVLVGWRTADGQRHGHATCLYRQGITWYWLDYSKIQVVDNFDRFPWMVAQHYGQTSNVSWVCHEEAWADGSLIPRQVSYSYNWEIATLP